MGGTHVRMREGSTSFPLPLAGRAGVGGTTTIVVAVKSNFRQALRGHTFQPGISTMTSVSITRARQLRAASTPPERRLWNGLRALRPLGFHFRRQVPLDGYFLDFVCFSARLVIEVDGSHHGHPEQQKHDQQRDAYLRANDFRVVRIPAVELLGNLDGVDRMIRGMLGVE